MAALPGWDRILRLVYRAVGGNGGLDLGQGCSPTARLAGTEVYISLLHLTARSAACSPPPNPPPPPPLAWGP